MEKQFNIEKKRFFKYLEKTEDENLKIKINLLNGKIIEKRQIKNNKNKLEYSDFVEMVNNVNDCYINEIILHLYQKNKINIDDNMPFNLLLNPLFDGNVEINYNLHIYDNLNIIPIKNDIEKSIIADEEIEKEFLFFVRKELKLDKDKISLNDIRNEFKKIEKEIFKGEKMLYEKGFIKILPTQEQFQKAKNKELDLNKLKNENRIKEVEGTNGSFKTCRIRIRSYDVNDEIQESKIINVSRNIDKVLFYANEQIPVTAILIEEKNKTEEKEYENLKLVGLEDSRSVETLSKNLKQKINEKENEG